MALATPAPARTPTTTDSDKHSSNERLRMLHTSLRAFPAARSISIFGRHRTLFLRAAVSTPNRFTSGPISSSRRLCIRPLGALPSRHADPPLNGRDLGPRLRARRRGGRGSGARHARWQQSGAQRRADAPHRQTKSRAPALESTPTTANWFRHQPTPRGRAPRRSPPQCPPEARAPRSRSTSTRRHTAGARAATK